MKRRVNRISNWYGGIPVENVFHKIKLNVDFHGLAFIKVFLIRLIHSLHTFPKRRRYAYGYFGLLIFVVIVLFFLLFWIVVLSGALLFFGRKSKKGNFCNIAYGLINHSQSHENCLLARGQG